MHGGAILLRQREQARRRAWMASAQVPEKNS
jgi:hypothetical protein